MGFCAQIIQRTISVVERAYRKAKNATKWANARLAGITHPVAVATILAEMGMTTPTLRFAALLHDTVEDTDFTLGTDRRLR